MLFFRSYDEQVKHISGIRVPVYNLKRFKYNKRVAFKCFLLFPS